MNNFLNLWHDSGLAQMDVGQGVMIVIGLLLLFLAIRKGFEPLLLVPIGFGGILAEGADRAADKLGLPKDAHYYTITTRGMTLPGDDPRGLGFGYGLSFSMGTRGGCDHLRSLCCLELSGALYPGLNTKLLGDESANKPVTTNSKP